MNHFALALLLALSILPASIPCQQKGTSVSARETDLAELRHIKTVLWPKAYREQDTALLDRILHDQFQMIDDGGSISTKAEEIAYIRANKPTYQSFHFEIERLEIFEERFAVVAGTGIIRNQTPKGPTETRYR
ncbi:MAG: nuclear transport factor 2 family protein [Acidobacteria bacterium]|nr:nuclear transport factor 2 family protein [Acidobacteriota bacterium]